MCVSNHKDGQNLWKGFFLRDGPPCLMIIKKWLKAELDFLQSNRKPLISLLLFIFSVNECLFQTPGISYVERFFKASLASQ